MMTDEELLANDRAVRGEVCACTPRVQRTHWNLEQRRTMKRRGLIPMADTALVTHAPKCPARDVPLKLGSGSPTFDVRAPKPRES